MDLFFELPKQSQLVKNKQNLAKSCPVLPTNNFLWLLDLFLPKLYKTKKSFKLRQNRSSLKAFFSEHPKFRVRTELNFTWRFIKIKYRLAYSKMTRIMNTRPITCSSFYYPKIIILKKFVCLSVRPSVRPIFIENFCTSR